MLGFLSILIRLLTVTDNGPFSSGSPSQIPFLTHTGPVKPRYLSRRDSNAADTLDAPSSTPPSAPSGEAGPQRAVYTITDLYLQDKGVSQIDGIDLFAAHNSLQLAGTSLDGPLLVEFGDSANTLANSSLHLRVLASPITNNTNYTTTSSGRYIFQAGTTTLRNNDFINTTTGAGRIADAWSKNPTYKTGVSQAQSVNEAVQLITTLLDSMQLAPTSEAASQFALSNRWHAEIAYPRSVVVDQLFYDFVDATNNDAATRSKFTMGNNTNPPLMPSPFQGPEYPPELAESPSMNDARLLPIPKAYYISLPEYDLEAALLGKAAVTCLKRDGCGQAGASPDSSDKVTTPTAETSDRKVTVSRLGGVVKLINVVNKAVVPATGVGGIIFGAFIVVLDFMHGQYVGFGCALAGLASGIGIGLLELGPVGWLLELAVGAFFAILPLLFKKQYPAAPISDIPKIIQWTMFGDRDHTGNEACRTQNATYHGDPNCTAVYGPGTISLSLGLNNFDAIAFLLHFNDGYPMSIPDMAAVFHINGTSYNGDDDTKAVATIDCHNSPAETSGLFGDELSDDQILCSHPKYAINRALITLPVINKPASEIYNRIIPNPGGDCSLLTFPGSQSFPQYDMTVNGLPSVIACNLSSALNVTGVAVRPEGSNDMNQAPAIASPGNASTDGQSGHHIAAPPAVPFQLLNSTNSVCIGGPQGSNGKPPPKTNPPIGKLCLPSGTYDGQTGVYGFQTGAVNTLDLPNQSGAYSLKVHYVSPPGSFKQARTYDTVFNTTQTPATNDLPTAMYFLTSNMMESQNMVIATAGDLPCVCLFSKPSFHGDVACFMVGGDMLPANVQKSAQSISVHGTASAWIYGQSYGDAGGVEVRGNIDDLSKEAYGATGTFSKAIVAMWVKPN